MAERVLSRPPSAQELTVLRREFERARDFYQAHPDQATAFVSLGSRPSLSTTTSTELAAHMLVASMLLNLDEAITHE